LESAKDLIEASYWIEPQRLRMLLPVSMLRMQGAFSYGKDHPFVAALSSGEDALVQFYEKVKPNSILDFYGISAEDRKGSHLRAWEIPWYMRNHRTPPPGESGLGAEHGVSFCGPASRQKVALEMSRLRLVAASISRFGYDPESNGDIEGYILKSGADACFFVRGGKHRAAALVYLGFEFIPVTFKEGFPRVIDASHAEFWPLVIQNQIDAATARLILQAYITGSHVQ
jgi:hypothetical protein